MIIFGAPDTVKPCLVYVHFSVHDFIVQATHILGERCLRVNISVHIIGNNFTWAYLICGYGDHPATHCLNDHHAEAFYLLGGQQEYIVVSIYVSQSLL